MQHIPSKSFLDGFYLFRPENYYGSYISSASDQELLRLAFSEQLEALFTKEVDDLYAAYRQFMPDNFGVFTL